MIIAQRKVAQWSVSRFAAHLQWSGQQFGIDDVFLMSFTISQRVFPRGHLHWQLTDWSWIATSWGVCEYVWVWECGSVGVCTPRKCVSEWMIYI